MRTRRCGSPGPRRSLRIAAAVPATASAEALWRQHPATEKQTALLRKLGLAARAGLTKGEAADLLAAVLGDWGVTKPLPTGDHASVDSECEMSFVAQHFH